MSGTIYHLRCVSTKVAEILNAVNTLLSQVDETERALIVFDNNKLLIMSSADFASHSVLSLKEGLFDVFQGSETMREKKLEVNLSCFVKSMGMLGERVKNIELATKDFSELEIILQTEGNTTRSILSVFNNGEDVSVPEPFSSSISDFTVDSKDINQMFIFPTEATKSTQTLTLSVENKCFSISYKAGHALVSSSLDIGQFLNNGSRSQALEDVRFDYPMCSFSRFPKLIMKSEKTRFRFNADGEAFVDFALGKANEDYITAAIRIQPIGDDSS